MFQGDVQALVKCSVKDTVRCELGNPFKSNQAVHNVLNILLLLSLLYYLYCFHITVCTVAFVQRTN